MSEASPFPTAQLADVVDILDNLRVPINGAERMGRAGTVPYYGANGFQGWIDRPLFNEPLILLAEDGGNFDDFATRPIAYRIDGPSWVNNHAHIIRAKTGVCQSFIFWSIVNKDTRKYIAGGTRTKLTQGELRRIEINFPIEHEQKGIANVLDTLDTAIHETEAIIAKLKAVKQGLLHDLLTRGIDANGELRPPQAEAPHLYKQSPLGWIPKDWEAVKLTSIVSNIGQGWSPDCESSAASSGSWGILKTTAITWAGYNHQENKALPISLKEKPDLEVKAGDILITRAGPASRVGVIAYVESSNEKLMISDKMYRVQTLPTELSAYISLALSSQAVQAALGRTLSGMAESQTNISQAIVKDLTLSRPQIEEQSSIVYRVRASEGRIREEEESLEKLKALKIGLMDDLLTGRVRVTPLLETAP